jgi:hypothetical protein
VTDVDHRLRRLDGIDVRDQSCQRACHGPFTGAEIEDPAGEAAGERGEQLDSLGRIGRTPTVRLDDAVVMKRARQVGSWLGHG